MEVSFEMEDVLNRNLLWRRPNNVPWPNVWYRFEGKSKSGQTYQIKIQDITEDRFEDVLDFMATEFDKKEPICSYPTVAHIFEDENVRLALRKVRRRVLEQRMSLFAVLDNDDLKPEIMGLELHLVTSHEEPHIQVPSEIYNQVVMEIIDEVHKNVDTSEIFESHEHIEDFGLAVAAKYYGLGISYHLFVALSKLAVTFNIGGALMVFSSLFSQKNAEKAGFKLLRELKFHDFKDENGKIKLPVEQPESVKYMFVKYSTNSITDIGSE